MAKKSQRPVIGLGLDPGKNNFGWMLIAARSMEDYVMLDSGLLYSVQSQDTLIDADFITNLTDEIQTLAILGEATHVAIERYTPRGNMVPMNQVEYVNVMIGGSMIVLKSLGMTVDAITASAWKQDMYFEDDECQRTHKTWFPHAQTEHSADAGCICLRSMWRHGLIPWPGYD